MNIYKLFTPQQLNIALTGTSGTANVSIDGTAYLATFDTTLATTAANFVALHAAAILQDSGFVVTNPSAANLLFKGADGRTATIVIANATTNLDGTPSGAVAAVPAVELTTSGIAAGGNVTVMQITASSGSFIDDVALEGSFAVLKREVKHETDLSAYATANTLSLSRTGNDGSAITVLV